MDFEEKMNQLEAINKRLQGGNLPLKDAIDSFEIGMKLVKEMEKELAQVEHRVEILKNEPSEPNETPKLELFNSESLDLSTESPQ